TEWIFNKTAVFDMDYGSTLSDKAGLSADQAPTTIPKGQPNGKSRTQNTTYLSLVMSASRKYTGVPQDEIVAMALKDVEACLPDVRRANLVRSRVVRWPKATFSPKPGVDALRPDQRSPISNLYVAGEWTRTDWPSTMESAARSGYR